MTHQTYQTPRCVLPKVVQLVKSFPIQVTKIVLRNCMTKTGLSKRHPDSKTPPRRARIPCIAERQKTAQTHPCKIKHHNIKNKSNINFGIANTRTPNSKLQTPAALAHAFVGFSFDPSLLSWPCDTRLIQSESLVHDKPGPLPHLFVDPADVFP